jgi:ubiquinone/menaquinone biosynthesis C-methylase UbiE
VLYAFSAVQLLRLGSDISFGVNTPASGASLWQRLWRRSFFKRAFYEALGLVLLRRRGLQMLNCGYAGDDVERFPLPPDDEPERSGYQLYHRLVHGTRLAGADVLEIGCGRGGGARFLAGHFAPRSYVATDAARLLIAAQRRRQPPVAGLAFRPARADRLPFEAATFDLCFSVEAVHPLPDKPAFLAEVARVLRERGEVRIADFFYTRETSPNAASAFRAHVERSSWRIAAEEDWTAPIVAALEADSPRRLAEIARLPRWCRSAALAFAGTTESPLYRQLIDGRAQYLFFRLVRK